MELEAPEWGALPSVSLQDGRVLMAGGADWSTEPISSLDTAQLFDARTGATTDLAPMGTARSWPRLLDLQDGSVIAAGGWSEERHIATAERYWLEADRWEEIPGEWPEGTVLLTRDRQAALVVNHEACGRFDVARTRMRSLRCPTGDRRFPGVIELSDGRILAVGGTSEDRKTSGATSMLDRRHRRWRERAPSPNEWSHPRMVELPGAGVLALGFDPEGGGPAIYDVALDRWESLPDVPERALGVLHAEGMPEGWIWGVSRKATWRFDPTTRTFDVLHVFDSEIFHAMAAGPGRVWAHGLRRIWPVTSRTAASGATPDPVFGSVAVAPSGDVLLAGDGRVHRLVPEGLGWVDEGVDLPRAATLVAVDEGVVALGGYHVEGSNSVPATDVWVRRDGAWTQAASMPSPADPYTEARAVALPDGRVLVASGGLYEPANDRWSPTPPLPGVALLALSDGRVVALGSEVAVLVPADLDVARSRRVALPFARTDYAAVVLPNDQILISGGMGTAGSTFHDDAWLLDPEAGTVAEQPRMTQTRWDHVLVTLPTGEVMAVGGSEHSAEVFDPETGTWLPTLTMPHKAQRPVAAAMADGAVVVVDDGVTQLFESRGPRVLPLELPPEAVSLGDPRAARWWRLEVEARCALATVIDADVGCATLDPEGLRPAGPRATRDPAAYPRRINPTTPEGVALVRGWRDGCWVLQPDRTPVVCAPGMLQKAWDRCVFGEVFRSEDRRRCWCEGPIGSGEIDCPR